MQMRGRDVYHVLRFDELAIDVCIFAIQTGCPLLDEGDANDSQRVFSNT